MQTSGENDKAKAGKATGIEDLSNEVLKSPNLAQTLFNLFRNCFEHGKLPSDWMKSIISPIPKSPKNDPRVPLNYRGISLMSTVYKLYRYYGRCNMVNFKNKQNLQHSQCSLHILNQVRLFIYDYERDDL